MPFSIHYVAIFACYFCLFAGLAGLIKPNLVAKRVGLKAINSMGIMEIRCMFGGLFIGLSITCLISGATFAYLAFSSVWLGGAAAKYIALYIDKPPFKAAFTSASFDAFIGLALLSGYYIQ
ncbi:hypothetical protein EDC56_0645 [Sinobacterium caligoides]|uniref:DUF4345 domain-containing protein n=1 Tax=Sinobacterium caligoides TaxID=933926 RepID=A0A3N2DZ81_9GAMM|nr:hypothetical protein [Sinobacterium caligoides]ROS05120.1 hypothetical protein EDC56_0645 [Sinobacterium caligoides]